MVRRRPGLGDLAVAAVVVLLAGLLFAARALLAPQGRTAEVITPDSSFLLPLDEDTSRTLVGNNGITVVLSVENGAIRFSLSGCPDQVCVHSGPLTRAGDAAACVPAGIFVRLTGEAEVDAVAG